MSVKGRWLSLLFSFWLAGSNVFPQSEKEGAFYASYLKGVLSDIYGDSRRALREYSKLKAQDEAADVNMRMALDYIRLKNYTAAAKVLEEERKRSTINADAHILLSLVYTALGKKEKAESVYEDFLRRLHSRYPDDFKVIRALANLELGQKRYSAAEKLYLSQIKRGKNLLNAYLGLAYVYDEEGKRDKALTLLESILAKFPDNAAVLNSLGYIYAEAGKNLDKAEAMVKKALEIEPDSAAYLDSLGWVYYQQHKFSLALKYLEKAYALEKDPVIGEHLAQVFYVLGNYKKAIEYWQKILRDFPQKVYLKEKIKKAENEQRKKR